MHAWEQYGPACVERLEGMFAFAILDERRRELFIARDRLGKKPLYYAVLDGVLHFASELPALAASPSWKGDLDLGGLEGYLSLGILPGAEHAVCRGLQASACPHAARQAGPHRDEALLGRHASSTPTRAGKRRCSTRWTRRFAWPSRIGSKVKCRSARFCLGASTLAWSCPTWPRRLAIVSSRRPLDLPKAAHNELAAARLTAAHVNARHYEDVIEPSLDEVLDPATIGSGEPMADSSAIPTWYVSRAARSHVTVALSGDGGDETFAGYDFRYVPHVLEARARRMVPGAAGRRLAPWTGRAWPRGQRVPKALRAGTLLDNLSRDAASAFFVDLCFLKPAPTRRLMGLDAADERSSAVYAAVTDVYRRCPSSAPLTCAQYTDLHVYMPNDPLVKVDRMSMAHGLEVRSPFLDRRVVELAFSMPPDLRLARADGQVDPARTGEAAAAGGPGHHAETRVHRAGGGVARRPVRGAATKARCLRRRHGRRSLIDRSVLRGWFDEHRAGRADHSYILWATWVLERWLRNVGATDATPADVVATR